MNTKASYKLWEICMKNYILSLNINTYNFGKYVLILMEKRKNAYGFFF